MVGIAPTIYKVIYTDLNNMQIQEFFWVSATKTKRREGIKYRIINKKKKSFFRDDLNEQKRVFVIVWQLITTRQRDPPVTQTLRTNHVAGVLLSRRDEIYFAARQKRETREKRICNPWLRKVSHLNWHLWNRS